MDPMHALDPRRCKPAADDKVDANRQDLACGIEIDAPHVPRFGNAESRFKQLVSASTGFCFHGRMQHNAAFSLTRLYGPAVAVKGSLRRASPALDRADRTLLSSANPLEFQKRQ